MGLLLFKTVLNTEIPRNLMAIKIAYNILINLINNLFVWPIPLIENGFEKGFEKKPPKRIHCRWFIRSLSILHLARQYMCFHYQEGYSHFLRPGAWTLTFFSHMTIITALGM